MKEDPFELQEVKSIDRRGVYRTYQDWPNLAKAGFGISVSLTTSEYRKVYVLGMGGSAAAGDILSDWLFFRHGIEAQVCKGVIPTRDMSNCLGIACSASGETYETISMMKTAKSLGATLVSTSHGGTLQAESARMGIPHVEMPEIVAPRYMLPFMVFSSIKVLDSALGLDSAKDAREAISEMGALAPSILPRRKIQKNPSKRLASRFSKKDPTIYCTRATRGVGIRFKNEMNENGKKHAIFDEMPELFHNEIEAWEFPESGFVPVILRDPVENDRDKKLADTFVRLLASKEAGPIELAGTGKSLLARLMTLTYRLDLASYYVAIAGGHDPSPTPLITELKKAV